MKSEKMTREQLLDELRYLRQRVSKFIRIYEDLDASVYEVAHDLKRSLSLILGFSGFLIEEYHTFMPDDVLDGLQVIAQAGEDMNKIVDELLLLTHVRDQEGPSLGSIDMGSIVTEAIARLSYIIERRQAEVMVPDMWPDAAGYGPWVEEVWYAFISEALRFDMEPLRIEAGGAVEDQAHSRFWVRVVACPPEQRSHVLQAQARFGSGLVRRIVEKLEGHYGVETDPEKGCDFYFVLPQHLES